MSYHKFSYYDYKSERVGKLLISVIAPSISEADKVLEVKFNIKIEKSPFIGCRIDFNHCHSTLCPKESFSIKKCACGFVQCHLQNQQLKKVNPQIVAYKFILSPSEQTKLIDLEPLLVALRERSMTLVLTDETEEI